MRFLFGRGWVFFDETNGEGDGNGDTGGAAGTGDGEALGDGAAEGDDATGGGAGGKGKDDEGAAGADTGDAGKPKDMLEAITKGLEKTAPKVDDPAAKAAEEAAAAAKAEKHANGAPKKDAKGNELDDKGQVVKPAPAPKAKTSTELQLSKEQLAALKPESRGRFAEVITTLKAKEAEVATLTEQMKPLAEARDGMIGVLRDTNTTGDQLSAYLEFNRMIQSNDPKDLRTALSMIEAQRGELYKALGEEPQDGGVDLLAEFPDLQAQVNDATLTRANALEIAQGRRERASAAERDKQDKNQQQSTAQELQKREDAHASITTWSQKLAAEDLDYKAKEDRLLEQVDEVIKNYPPNQWLSTLKLLYSGITVSKSAPLRKEIPLRPSGAKPGAKAPTNMFEAMWGADKATG